MRVQLRFIPEAGAGPVIISQDFRHYFISVFKSLIESSPIYQRYAMDKPGYAPYAMAVEFGHISGLQKEERLLEIQPPVFMNISTGDIPLFTEICNGAIRLRKKLSILGMLFDDVMLLPPVNFSSGVAEFKTMGHAVLPTGSGNIGDKGCDNIEEALNHHMKVRAEYLRGQWNLAIPELEPCNVLNTSGLRHGVCLHYGGYLTTVFGSFSVQGSAPSLQFLYDYGMGSRNGQAFGLLKVVNRQWD